MKKLLLEKDLLLEKIKNKEIIPQGYGQRISYNLMKKVWFFVLLWQVIVYWILSEYVETNVNIVICILNVLLTYFLIVFVFVDSFNNNSKKIYHLKWLENYYRKVNEDEENETTIFAEIESGTRKCSFLEFVTYLLRKWLSVTCVLLVVGAITIKFEHVSNIIRVFIIIIVCLLYMYLTSRLFHKVFIDKGQKS